MGTYRKKIALKGENIIMKHLSKVLKTIIVVLAVVMACTFMLVGCFG